MSDAKEYTVWFSWDDQTMEDIEQNIKTVVNQKLQSGTKSIDPIGETDSILIMRNDKQSANGAFIADWMPSTTFFQNVQGITTVNGEDGSATLTLAATDIVLDGNIATVQGKLIVINGPITFKKITTDAEGAVTEVEGTIDGDTAAFTTVSANKVVADTIEVGSVTIQDDEVTGGTGTFTTVAADTIGAGTVTATNLVGTNLYIGENASDTTKIDLTPTELKIKKLTATEKLTATSAQIAGYDSFDKSYNLNQTVYRPVLFTTETPTVEKGYTPGLLIAVIQ